MSQLKREHVIVPSTSPPHRPGTPVEPKTQVITRAASKRSSPSNETCQTIKRPKSSHNPTSPSTHPSWLRSALEDFHTLETSNKDLHETTAQQAQDLAALTDAHDAAMQELQTLRDVASKLTMTELYVTQLQSNHGKEREEARQVMDGMLHELEECEAQKAKLQKDFDGQQQEKDEELEELRRDLSRAHHELDKERGEKVGLKEEVAVLYTVASHLDQSFIVRRGVDAALQNMELAWNYMADRRTQTDLTNLKDQGRDTLRLRAEKPLPPRGPRSTSGAGLKRRVT